MGGDRFPIPSRMGHGEEEGEKERERKRKRRKVERKEGRHPRWNLRKAEGDKMVGAIQVVVAQLA